MIAITDQCSGALLLWLTSSAQTFANLRLSRGSAQLLDWNGETFQRWILFGIEEFQFRQSSILRKFCARWNKTDKWDTGRPIQQIFKNFSKYFLIKNLSFHLHNFLEFFMKYIKNHKILFKNRLNLQNNQIFT